MRPGWENYCPGQVIFRGPRNPTTIEGILEKAVDYIRHLEERGGVLEQEGGALKARLAFWTSLS